MASIVQFPRAEEVQVARPRAIQRPAAVKLIGGDFVEEVAQPRSQKAEPIKSAEDIQKVTDYLITNRRYRDNLLFICGINFGLRIGDLLRLKVGHLLNPDGMSYRTQITIKEEKTDKFRIVYPNDAVMDAADLYFQDLQMKREPIDLNDYLFRNLSHNKTRTIVERDEDGNVIEKKQVTGVTDEHMTIRSVDRMLKNVINDKCHIDIHASTHCLRKTFAYHVIITASDRPRAVEFLQKIFGHSDQSITLHYAGITDDEIMKTYQQLNLGQGMDLGYSSGLKLAAAQ